MWLAGIPHSTTYVVHGAVHELPIPSQRIYLNGLISTEKPNQPNQTNQTNQTNQSNQAARIFYLPTNKPIACFCFLGCACSSRAQLLGTTRKQAGVVRPAQWTRGGCKANEKKREAGGGTRARLQTKLRVGCVAGRNCVGATRRQASAPVRRNPTRGCSKANGKKARGAGGGTRGRL